MQLVSRIEPKGGSTKFIFSAVSVCLAFSATPSHAAVDVCKLLTVDQVQAATKIKVLPAVPETATDTMVGKCKFAQPGAGQSVVVIAVYKPESIEVEKRMWTHPQFLKVKPVPGVGDYAYYLENPHVLYAGSGNSKAVKIQMPDGPSGDASLEALKTLAREALARL